MGTLYCVTPENTAGKERSRGSLAKHRLLRHARAEVCVPAGSIVRTAHRGCGSKHWQVYLPSIRQGRAHRDIRHSLRKEANHNLTDRHGSESTHKFHERTPHCAGVLVQQSFTGQSKSRQWQGPYVLLPLSFTANIWCSLCCQFSAFQFCSVI